MSFHCRTSVVRPRWNHRVGRWSASPCPSLPLSQLFSSNWKLARRGQALCCRYWHSACWLGCWEAGRRPISPMTWSRKTVESRDGWSEWGLVARLYISGLLSSADFYLTLSQRISTCLRTAAQGCCGGRGQSFSRASRALQNPSKTDRSRLLESHHSIDHHVTWPLEFSLASTFPFHRQLCSCSLQPLTIGWSRPSLPLQSRPYATVGTFPSLRPACLLLLL